MMEQLCGESGDSQKKMHADVSTSSTGNGCRAGASCVLAAVGRSAEAGADCGTISSAGLGLLACLLLLLLLTARLVDRVHFNNGPPNVVMIDQRSNKRSSALLLALFS